MNDAAEELPDHRGIDRDPSGSAAAPLEFPCYLCRRRPEIDQKPFKQGYVAGWQSVRGADDQPLLIPPSPVLVGPAIYIVGFYRGARDARAMATASGES